MERWECLFCEQPRKENLFYPFCPECGQPLIVFPRKRAPRFRPARFSSLSKFEDFLPLPGINEKTILGEGDTPLLRLNRLEKKLKLKFSLYAKNEMVNPTHSFKDRGTTVVMQKISFLGVNRLGTVSTGNMASSTAAYGSKAGIKTYVLLKEDAAREKIISTGIYGAHLFLVKGDYGQLFKESYRLGEKLGIYFANSCDPYRLAGYKLTSFEVYLQLGQQSPDYVFVPVSSAGHLTGLVLGFLDLKQAGFISRLPHFIGVQAKGCSPLAKAWSRQSDDFIREKHPQTLAHAISNPAPPAGRLALKMLRCYKGGLLAVTDNEIIKAQLELASTEGLFCDPASATTLAGLKKWLRLRASFSPVRVVLILTGSGLKDMAPVMEKGMISLIPVSLSGLEEALTSLSF
ncbi:MAG: threonine synthase [Candidatus Aminicenantales bacterium]